MIPTTSTTHTRLRDFFITPPSYSKKSEKHSS